MCNTISAFSELVDVFGEYFGGKYLGYKGTKQWFQSNIEDLIYKWMVPTFTASSANPVDPGVTEVYDRTLL